MNTPPPSERGSAGGQAFGAPGIAPTWSSSDKDFVTTALNGPRLWATIGHGIVNEVYWPSTGEPQIRDFGFYLVGAARWIDLKRERRYQLSMPRPHLPLPTIVHQGEDYELTLEVLPDPLRDVLLVRFRLQGPYRLAVIVAPHLGSTGRDNNAWIDGNVGYARRGDRALCLSAEAPLTHLSCGYVGFSDGWQDLRLHGRLTWGFDRADCGTVALSGELAEASGVVALGFAPSPHGALMRVRTALASSFDVQREQFLEPWRKWSSRLELPRPDEALGEQALLSATLLKIHEDRAYPGAVVASLSIPWGNSTDSLGGYHLVWPRDTTLTAFALLAAQQLGDARNILAHLIASQCRDGHWPQNYFPDGGPYWRGTQLDETALPLLLAAKLAELGQQDLPGTADMVRAAVTFILRTGPSSPQDRWEENPGVSPFTVATCISALLAAGRWLSEEESDYASSVADDWNERLELWCYVSGTKLSERVGVEGYYVRIGRTDAAGKLDERVQLRNRKGEWIPGARLVSLDFSYLVRLGLRRALDPRVQNTIRVVDHLLKVQTPSGALYHRYNDDGYGEHADGRPFDGSGIGRAWPLLAGERGHLALQSGQDPLEYLQSMHRCASAGGLLPEQVWESPPIPERGLFPGRPSGSAMPLVWAHAEFLKLLVAREHGRPVELLSVVEERYGTGTAAAPPAAPIAAPALRGTAADGFTRPRAWHWRTGVPIGCLPRDRDLRIEAFEPFTLHFGFDGWKHIADRAAVAEPFGIWSVRFSAQELGAARAMNFTRLYAHGWENVDHRIELTGPR